ITRRPQSLALLAVLGNALAAPLARAERGVPEPIQARIVRLYSEGRCADVRSLVRKVELTRLRPNVMAIAASCEPPGDDCESLFERAEKANPTGDLILVLHARHLAREKGAAAAEPLWQRVLMVARNEYFRRMAKDYLAGVVDPKAPQGPLDLTPSTG